jgi:hypothetical protein
MNIDLRRSGLFVLLMSKNVYDSKNYLVSGEWIEKIVDTMNINYLS